MTVTVAVVVPETLSDRMMLEEGKDVPEPEIECVGV